MALSFSLDLIGGQVFELLSESVTRAVDRKAAFGELLQNMKYTLKSLKRQAIVIQQIQEYNVELSLSNDEMIALVTQMTEGRQLVDKLSGIRFRFCNFCCVNGLADQLKELNMSLESLFDNLQLEQVRDVKETLKLSRQNHDDLEKMKVMLEKIMQMIDDPEVKDLLKKVVDKNANGSMKSSTSTSTLGSGSCTENEGNCVTQVPSSKALVEPAFQVLLNAVIEVKESTTMFRPLLLRLQSTLHYLLPFIGEMVQCNKALDRPKEELENMRIQMENGLVLVEKCLNVRRWTRKRKYLYSNQLFDLNYYLQEQLNILLVQLARDVRETSVLIRNIKEVIKRDERSDMAENQLEYKVCSYEPPLPTVELETNMQGRRDAMMETLVSVKNIEEGVKGTEGRIMVDEVSETLSPTVGIEVLNMDATEDVIKETQASTENTNVEVNQIEGGAEDERSDIAENQLEYKVCSYEPPLPTVELETNMQGRRDAMMETLVSVKNIEEGVKGTEGRIMVDEVSETLSPTVGIEVLNMDATEDVIKETQASTENTNVEVNQIEGGAEAQLASIASLESQQQTEGINKVHGTLGHYDLEKPAVSKESFSPYLPRILMPQEFNSLKKDNVFPERPGTLDKEYKTNWIMREPTFKVHRSMCIELCKLVDRISKILTDIEAARPRCSTGLQALCMLNRAIEKAKQLVQYCSESSKLYLALTGDLIVSICQKSRNLMEQSLCQIQSSVPVIFKAEICKIIYDLKAATFRLDPSEEEAGKVVRELLQQSVSASSSVEDFELKALQLASVRLHITSSTEVIIEKRSVKMLLQKVGDSDPQKKQILKYFLYLFNKYGNLMLEKQTENAPVWQQGSLASENSGKALGYHQSAEATRHPGYGEYEAQSNMLLTPVPPEEFLCGISSRLMYDPVTIASGITYERMWIQEWFDEGNDTCPKTNFKLPHLTLTPNISMKELTSRWCTKHGVTIPDPNSQREALSSWENSSITASSRSSLSDLLQMDLSIIFDASFYSDTKDDSNMVHSNDDLEFLSNISELNWDSQCMAVEDVSNHLKSNPQAAYDMSSKNFVTPLIKFLKDAHDKDDVEAQRNGYKLLSTFVSKDRNGISFLCEDIYGLLVSSLDSKVKEEGLAIMELLSFHQDCRRNISSSGALTSLLKLLDSQISSTQERALEVLYNLSFSRDICSEMVSLECIPKLVPLLQDSPLTGLCVSILKNLCDSDRARNSIAETDGCIASVVDVLDSGSKEHQECAVDILLSLCSQRIDYCRLVMDEGVIPGLVDSSANGTERARINAKEVLRLLRDIDYVPEQDSVEPEPQPEAPRDELPRASLFFGKKMSIFSKPTSLSPKKKK